MGAAPKIHVLLVTGPSGAGRTTAIQNLEDLGYEGIDNVPLSLVPQLLDGLAPGRFLALGLDVRNRDFTVLALIDLIDRMARDPAIILDVLYLECSTNELVRRYSLTRRRHPLAPDGFPAEGVVRENELLSPIRARADHLIDTSDLSPHELKAEIRRCFAQDEGGGMNVCLQSFSYRRGLPEGCDMVFDCRFLANPYWRPELRELDGRSKEVIDYVRNTPQFDEFYRRLVDLLLFLLPMHVREGKAHLSIGFGCTGGQHRSVTLVELMATTLSREGWSVAKRHREIERGDALLSRPLQNKVAGS